VNKAVKDQIKPEVGRIFGQIVDEANYHPRTDRPLKFTFALDPLFYEQSVHIAKALEDHFPNGEIFATLDVKANADSLDVTLFYPPRYEIDEREGRWFVDSMFEDCWYFELGDKESAQLLAQVLNTAPNPRKLRHLRPNIGIDEASLKLLLLGFRSDGIDVTTFAHKGTGAFDKNNLLK
jgi:hypothetical protein